MKQVLRAYIFCGACGNNRTNRGGFQFAAARLPWFFDQAISANTNYDPSRFEGDKVPMMTLLSDLLLAYKMGVKTLYYHNTRDGAGKRDDDEPQNPLTQAVAVEPEDECDGACKI
ncbi:hypothetical protein U9Y48_19155 [Escherichia coli]